MSKKIGARVVVGALAVALLWLAVGGIGGAYMGKLAELQENDNASFLPATAESTRVNEALEGFSSTSALPLILVTEREGGLTPADLATMQGLAKQLPDVKAEGVPLSAYLPPGPLPFIPSEDGEAAMVILSLDAEAVFEGNDDGALILDGVGDAVRDAAEGTLEGLDLQAYVSGPAGLFGDLTKAFGSIDGMLLYTALGVVLVILLVVYRSPVLPFAVLLTAIFGLSFAGFVVYQVADQGWITVSGQSQAILSILAVGAATDYALLLVARYKEELHDTDSSWEALKKAWRATLEPISASAATVILGLLALMLAELEGTAGLGPVAALGIVGSLLAALTFLPALLVLGRRWIFWPAIPKLDHQHSADRLDQRKGWGKVARFVGAHPRRTWVVTLGALLIAGAFMPTLQTNGLALTDTFRGESESVTGQEIQEKHYGSSAGNRVLVVAPQAEAESVVAAIAGNDKFANPVIGLEPGQDPKVVDGQMIVQATILEAIYSPEATEAVRQLRLDLDEVSTEVLVGGEDAGNLDVLDASKRDLKVVIPAIVLVVFLVLCLLLRSFVAPLMLVVANLLSFAATIGISAIMFNHVFKFPGGDAGTTLFGFVFLVALGVDYSIFLMTRAREETLKMGSRKGMLLALTVTGSVITSAGIVLAATFGALAVVPIVFMAQIAFIVAFGVLLDTFVVRSLLVPALSLELGEKTWWPNKMRPKNEEHAEATVASPSD